MRTQKSSNMTLTAETLGAALGRIAARADDLNNQRAALLKELTAITGAAETLLSNPGGFGVNGHGPRKRGRPKGYKMSEETRAKLRAAWRRRKREGAGKGRSA